MLLPVSRVCQQGRQGQGWHCHRESHSAWAGDRAAQEQGQHSQESRPSHRGHGKSPWGQAQLGNRVAHAVTRRRDWLSKNLLCELRLSGLLFQATQLHYSSWSWAHAAKLPGRKSGGMCPRHWKLHHFLPQRFSVLSMQTEIFIWKSVGNNDLNFKQLLQPLFFRYSMYWFPVFSLHLSKLLLHKMNTNNSWIFELKMAQTQTGETVEITFCMWLMNLCNPQTDLNSWVWSLNSWVFFVYLGMD